MKRSPLVLAALFALTGACSSETHGSAGSGAATSSSAGTGGGATSSSSSASTGEGGATSSTSSANGGAGGAGGTGGGAECPEPPGAPGPQNKLVVGTVTGKVVDTAGAPVSGLVGYVCGLNYCTDPNVTDAAGGIAINANDKEIVAPAFKYGDGLTHGRFIDLLDKGGSLDVGTAVTAKLPASGPKLEAGKKLGSGDLALSVAPGGGIVVDELEYETPESQLFRAAAISKDKFSGAIDAALGFEVVYAVAPLETHFCPPAAAAVPNTFGWAAGAEVEFFVHGGSVFEDFAPYGGWKLVSGGKVSADGATIATNEGEGLPVLANLGIRLKP